MKIEKLIFCLLLLIICAWGCTEKETFTYQLTNEKFVDILSDLHFSESATQHLSLSYRDSMSNVYLGQVLEIHEVPNEVFIPNYNELKRDPQKLALVYELVIKRLNELKLKTKKDGQATKKRTKKK